MPWHGHSTLGKQHHCSTPGVSHQIPPKAFHQGSLLQLGVSCSTGAFGYWHWDFLVIRMAKNFFSSMWGGRIPRISALKEHLFNPLWKSISAIPSPLSSSPLSSSSLSPSSLSYHLCPIIPVTITPVTIIPVPSPLSHHLCPIIPLPSPLFPSSLSRQHCHHLCHHHACPIFPVPSFPSHHLCPITSVPSSLPKRETRAIPGRCTHQFNPIKQHPKDFPRSGARDLLMMGEMPGKIHLRGQEPAPGKGRSRGKAAALDPGCAGKSQLPAVPRCPGRTWRLRREGPSVTAVTRPEGRLGLLTSASSSCFPLWGCRGERGGTKPGKRQGFGFL